MATKLSKVAKERGIEYFLISFVEFQCFYYLADFNVNIAVRNFPVESKVFLGKANLG